MASSSSSSSSFTLPSLFSIAVLILTVSTAESLKPPLHPRDLLPLLPKQVSWPILNSLYGAADLLPTFIGTASPGNDDVKWKGACFYENTAYLEFHNKSGSEFGGGTLHIQVPNQKKKKTRIRIDFVDYDRDLSVLLELIVYWVLFNFEYWKFLILTQLLGHTVD